MAKKVKKKKNAQGADSEFKNTIQELHLLKTKYDYSTLQVKSAIFERSKSAHNLKRANIKLQETEDDFKNISTDMTRQYKSMKGDLQKKNNELCKRHEEMNVEMEKRDKNIKELKKTIKEERNVSEIEIESLKMKIQEMDRKLETVVRNCLDTLVNRIDYKDKEWQSIGKLLTDENKKTLKKFGIDPDISNQFFSI